MVDKNNCNIISVDLGTGSVRACLVNRSLDILKKVDRPINLMTDPEGKAVQDTQKIIQTAYACIQKIIEWAKMNDHMPHALCFSNASASLVCLDSDFKPIGLALTYADMRASKVSHTLIRTYAQDTFRRTAAPIHASYWLPKFLWLKNSDFDLSQCRYFCTIKDLLVFQLTGQFVIDKSNAAATGMCNAIIGDWDKKLLTIAGIRADQLPKIHTTTAIFEPIYAKAVISTNTPANLKIILGAMDGVLSSLGAGAFKPGQVTTMIGSSGACRVAADSPLIEQDELKTWSYPLDDQIWIRGGAMNNGGLVTRWLVQNFVDSQKITDKAYYELFEAAKKIKPGANGLIFLPYLFGERAPIYDEDARGVYFGLRNSHNRGHFARAGLEGILMALYSIYEVIHPNIQETVEIRATGGYLRSDLMLQIQADVFGSPINVPHNPEGSIIGAAALALKACGIIESYDEISKFITIKRSIQPNNLTHQKYQRVFKHFKALYQHLQPVFQLTAGD